MNLRTGHLAFLILILSTFALTACYGEVEQVTEVPGNGGIPAGEVSITPTPNGESEPKRISPGTVLLGSILLIGAVVIVRAVWQSNRKSHFRQPFEPTGRSTNAEEVMTTSGAGAKLSAASERIVQSDQIFISYRRDDSIDVTGRIYDRLVKQFGTWTVFKDVDSIPLGVNFKDHLDEKVGQCRILIAIIGNSWITIQNTDGKRRIEDPADFIRIELNAAFDRNIPIIPVLVQHARMPMEKELPDDLKRLAYYNGISVRPDPDFHRDMDRLIAGIKDHLDPRK